VQIAPALRFLLIPRRRPLADRLPVDTDGTSSVVHLLESLGIPRTEFGPITIDGRPAAPTEIPEPGQLLSVEPVARPQQGAQRGFLLDVGLGSLARALRLLGVDAQYRNDATDQELVARSQATGRILLTQDRGLLRRRDLPQGALVQGSGTTEQLASVLHRFAPHLRPWTRCPVCNGKLVTVPKAAVAPRLEPGTRRCYQEFAECGSCGRVYWRGAHASALNERIRWARDVVAEARAELPQDEERRAQSEHEHASGGEQDQPRGRR
jgi:uncharacterized protein with PIN domain